MEAGWEDMIEGDGSRLGRHDSRGSLYSNCMPWSYAELQELLLQMLQIRHTTKRPNIIASMLMADIFNNYCKESLADSKSCVPNYFKN